MLPNFANRTLWTGDNLPILRGMNDASVDLIYLDPPFNSNANYAAPTGSRAAGAEFTDTWTPRGSTSSRPSIRHCTACCWPP
jgi:hypothetical protein